MRNKRKSNKQTPHQSSSAPPFSQNVCPQGHIGDPERTKKLAVNEITFAANPQKRKSKDQQRIHISKVGVVKASDEVRTRAKELAEFMGTNVSALFVSLFNEKWSKHKEVFQDGKLPVSHKTWNLIQETLDLLKNFFNKPTNERTVTEHLFKKYNNELKLRLMNEYK
jgi:hypothetical protein